MIESINIILIKHTNESFVKFYIMQIDEKHKDGVYLVNSCNAMPSVQSQGGGAQLGKEAVRPPNASTPIGMTSAAAATLCPCPAYNHKVVVLNSVAFAFNIFSQDTLFFNSKLRNVGNQHLHMIFPVSKR